MPMMYAIISACQDWLRARVARGLGGGDDGEGPGVAEEDTSEAAEAAAKLAAAEAEEARLAAARALGTPVTPATFAAWRARFDAEMASVRAARSGDVTQPASSAAAPRLGAGTGAGAGPTGRAYFQALDAGAAAAEGGDGGDEDGGGFPQEEEEEEEEDVSDLSDEDLDELNELLAQASKVAD